MTNILIRMWSAWFVAAAILLSSAGIMAFDGDSQLFGKKEDEKNVPLKKAEKKMAKKAANIQKPPKSSLPKRKNIESVIPVKRLPNGWVFRDELLAPWSTTLPAVLTIVPDTSVEVIYSDESRTTKDNVVKKIKLKDTGFPQLTAEDVIKHKVLMEYGTPKEFDGVWHIYTDGNSKFRVRKLDERNVKVEVDGYKVAELLNKAIEDVYSQQGIEYKKRLMMDGIDL